MAIRRKYIYEVLVPFTRKNYMLDDTIYYQWLTERHYFLGVDYQCSKPDFNADCISYRFHDKNLAVEFSLVHSIQ